MEKDIKKIGKKSGAIRDLLAFDRTTLANERTFLAYIRTFIGAIGTGIGLIKIFQRPIFNFIGGVFILSGILCFALGIRRYSVTRRNLIKFYDALIKEEQIK